MKFKPLGLVYSFAVLILLLGMLFGLSISIVFPLLIVATALEVVLTFIVWYKEGRSFKPLGPLSLGLIGALAIVAVWVYFQR
jgi:hypothetical protein